VRNRLALSVENLLTAEQIALSGYGTCSMLGAAKAMSC